MPVYDFKCSKCGHVFEQQTKFDDPCPSCPVTSQVEGQPEATVCGGETIKQFSRGGTFHLKGSGWAKDGY